MQDGHEKREFGEQPLEALMQEFDLENGDLVDASTEQVTYKMVAKGRKGRWLTPNIREKLCRAFNAASGQSLKPEDLFNYR